MGKPIVPDMWKGRGRYSKRQMALKDKETRRREREAHRPLDTSLPPIPEPAATNIKEG